MKKFTILIPVYNDWESLNKLLHEINNIIYEINDINFNCLVVNDSSTEPCPDIKVPSNFSSIKIINMKENKGHARCNAFGIRHLSNEKECDYVILMDGDGEDKPSEIKLLVEKVLSEPDTSVVAKRVKRSEGFLFQLMYKAHKIITIIFTGKNINFGNYSCLTKRDIVILSNESSLWSSFSASLKKHIPKYNSINSTRGLRYFGPSKMSLFKLLLHSFSIIAVFKQTVFIRSVIFIIILAYFSFSFNYLTSAIQILLVIFNLIIYVISLRENREALINSNRNIGEIKIY